MNIIDKRKMGKKYEDLKTGDCFQLNDEIYIKTDIIAETVSMHSCAVSLFDGTKIEIGKKVIVFPVNAELFIR